MGGRQQRREMEWNGGAQIEIDEEEDKSAGGQAVQLTPRTEFRDVAALEVLEARAGLAY